MPPAIPRPTPPAFRTATDHDRQRCGGAARGANEPHPDFHRRRRGRKGEGHHPRLPFPAPPVRRPEPPAHRSGRTLVIRQPATGSRRPPAAMPVAVGLLILLAAGGLPASPTPSSLVEEATRSMQKARETGDPTWYWHAPAAVYRAVAMDAAD